MDPGLLAVISGTIIAAILAFIGFKLRARFRHLDAKLERLTLSVRRDLEQLFDKRLASASLEIQTAIALLESRDRAPLFLGGWSIDAFLARYLLEHLARARPRAIVELGSGSSTLLIARTMARVARENYIHIAIDHDQEYLEITRSQLETDGLAERVRLWCCPLHPISPGGTPWYSGVIDRLSGVEIDLLLIDGPPGIPGQASRYPAIPLLYGMLSKDAVVVLDDVSRADEAEIVRRWRSEHPDLEVSVRAEGHGFAILRRARNPD